MNKTSTYLSCDQLKLVVVKQMVAGKIKQKYTSQKQVFRESNPLWLWITGIYIIAASDPEKYISFGKQLK